MFDSYTPRNFHTKKTDQRGSWACYAHIKILHSPHLHWLSHVMQFSKKEQVIWARLLTAFEKILDSPHLHLILIHWYVFEPPRQKWGFLMIFVFKAGVKFKIAFQIEQKILISVCYYFPPSPSPPAKLIICASPPLSSFDFFHLNPTQRMVTVPTLPYILFYYFSFLKNASYMS